MDFRRLKEILPKKEDFVTAEVPPELRCSFDEVVERESQKGEAENSDLGEF